MAFLLSASLKGDKDMKKRLAKGFIWLEDRKCYRYKFTFDSKSRYVYGKTTAECEEKANALKESLKQHMNLDNRRITLEKYYNTMWLEEQAKEVKQSTLYAYEKPWKYLSEYFGQMRIVDIQKADIISFQKHLHKDRTASTGNNGTRLLKQILNSAVNDRIINYNPCVSVKPLKVEKAKATETNHRALNVEETETFLEYVKESHYEYLFQFLLNTGCRVGEALALTWFDVNLDRKEVNIKSTVSRTSDKGFELLDTPKTSSSTRVISITDDTVKILRRQRERTKLLFSHCQWVFPNSRGDMANYNSVNICIANIVKNINEKDIRFEHFSVHAFRDTFATRCFEQGVTLPVLVKLMGHANEKMLMKIYLQVSTELQARELSKVRIAIPV